MGIFRGSIRSKSLMMDTTVNIVIPYEDFYMPPKAPHNKTVILLHGMKQNADTWCRMSRIEQFAHMTGFNVVMPEAQRSFYTDMPYGLDYFTYVADELPWMLEKVFNIPTDPDHFYVAGLSMGGFGAMKCALTYPEKFAGALSYSGALRCMEHIQQWPDVFPADEYRAVLGMDLRCEPENNLMLLAENAAQAAHKPKLYIACGTEDFLITENHEFCQHVQQLGFDSIYEEWPGVHDWVFWDRACGRSLALMAGLKPEDVGC